MCVRLHFLMTLGGDSWPVFKDNLLPFWTEQRWSSMRLLWKRLSRSKKPSSPSASGLRRYGTRQKRRGGERGRAQRGPGVYLWYLLWTLSGSWVGVQGVAGVLQDLTGAAALALLPTQAADEEQLGGAFGQGRFGQDVAAPLLTLQQTAG